MILLLMEVSRLPLRSALRRHTRHRSINHVFLPSCHHKPTAGSTVPGFRSGFQGQQEYGCSTARPRDWNPTITAVGNSYLYHIMMYIYINVYIEMCNIYIYYLYTYIHTYVRTYVRTYIHTYIHTRYNRIFITILLSNMIAWLKIHLYLGHRLR